MTTLYQRSWPQMNETPDGLLATDEPPPFTVDNENGTSPLLIVADHAGTFLYESGTDPDIEIDNAPQDAAAGRDRQLEVALQTALESADKTTPNRAPVATRPVLAKGKLPPRS